MKNLSEYFDPFIKMDKIYIKPNIPQKKLINAINSYANGVNPDEIEILIDDNVFGSAKNGAVISNAELYVKASFEEATKAKLSQIQFFEIKSSWAGNDLYINNKKVAEFVQASKKDLIETFRIINLYLKDYHKSEQLDQNLSFADKKFQQNTTQQTHSFQKANSLFKTYHDDRAITNALLQTDHLFIKGLDLFINPSTQSEKLRMNTRTFIEKSFVHIYKNYLEKQNKIELMNDGATLEIVQYICVILRLELLRKNCNVENVDVVILEALKEVYKDEEFANFSLCIIQNYMECEEYQFNNDLKEMFITFIFRMFFTNLFQDVAYTLEEVYEREEFIQFYTARYGENFDIKILLAEIRAYIPDFTFDTKIRTDLKYLCDEIADILLYSNARNF
ncbi:hypothetical protein CQA38_07545 [Campylobacter sp. MIT 12-5580]|uniref:hypothetical protein n=1 Tax=Campylobacter sp. MIT 12-5580 TaxID=2040651 RepID=UPI0010F9A030|nr:hypothetical protein [Campylobacter sp. MIT 12-5580]TKX28521.1 hypothetical protein CQA38_07545 [Campylobacter sp. MIT 12-5580]